MKKAAQIEPQPQGLRVVTPMMRRTLQDSVYQNLREALMCGQFGPGERLPASSIAQAFGTSIMPVREAFRRLTSQGALEPLSNGTTRIPIISAERIAELTELRLLLEGLATNKAAARATPRDCDVLEEMNAAIHRAFDRQDVIAEARANEEFHFAVYRLSGSEELVRIIEQLWLKVGPYLTWILKQGRWPARGKGVRTFRHHRDILLALRRQDGPAAETALRQDLLMAVDVLLEHARAIEKLEER